MENEKDRVRSRPVLRLAVVSLALAITVLGVVPLAACSSSNGQSDASHQRHTSVPVAKDGQSESAGQHENDSTGKSVFQKACSACHLSGAAGAPKVSDTAEWQKRLSAQGKAGLYSRAVNGYKAMPPKGGRPGLSKKDVHRAVDYILKRSGAR